MRSKRVLLGVTGGIAAYKTPLLVRLLTKHGFDVRCVLTPCAVEFVSPLVLASLSSNPTESVLISEEKTWNNHIELAEWADLFVIAPLTANSLAKMATGICDNLLMAVYFSMKSKTVVAPAMDLDMYRHSTVSRNLNTLVSDGVEIIPAETGELASGLVGQGRMAEPEKIFEVVKTLLAVTKSQLFDGKKVLITAGPTYESIDPVRFIGNQSTGKMGFSLAQVLLENGAHVTLISGPTDLCFQHANLTLIKITTADEMFTEVQKYWSNCDLGIFTAAVADYRPKVKAIQKIKKKSEELTIELIKNPDILNWAGSVKNKKQILVGFALETNEESKNAQEKLKKKNLDFIVLNSLQDKGAGFAVDTNKVTIFDSHKNKTELSLKSKYEIAKEIVLFLEQRLKK